MMALNDNDAVHSLPPFANTANRELSEKIKSMESKLSFLVNEMEENGSRADIMSQHMKNVKQELVHTQGIYDAKCRQIDTEDHFKQLADRECGRLTTDITRVEKEIASLTDQLAIIQNNIYRGNEKIEAIRSELKFEKEELEEWLRVQAEKEEDNLAILKYSKEDEIKIKELSLGIEKLTQEVNKKKALLSTEVTETQISQIELDKATEAFKKLHIERQEMINQWETAIKNMQEQDKEIIKAQELFKQSKEKIKEKSEKIKEKQSFLSQQQANNSEIEKKITICERNVSLARVEQTDANANLLQHRDEVEVVKSTLNKTATTLSQCKSQVTALKSDLQLKQNQLSKEKYQQEELKKKLEKVNHDKTSMEEKAAQFQEMLNAEEARDKELEKELKAIAESKFKKAQELHRLKQEEKNMIAEITGSESALRNLKAKLYQIDQESIKQQAMLYANEFQIQQLERKVRRAQGERSDEEQEKLVNKINELTTKVETLSSKHAILTTQVKKAQDDLRQSKRKMEAISKEKQQISESIDELQLYNESASHQLSAKVREKEEYMVEENIRRLEIRKLRGFLNSKADEVFSLENRQVGLQSALESRTKEIDIHKDILRIQLKNAEEERHLAHSELRDRVGKIEKLKRRYEILMTQFAPEEGEEEHSQAYYVIKAAQEREELQREGDELDASIRKAEKEIKALENTLSLMNNRNEEYRLNIYKSELDSKDIQHKEMLELKYRQVMEVYKQKREMIQDFQQQLLQLERNLSTLNNDESTKLSQIQALTLRIQQLEADILEQQNKKERAKKSIVKSSSDYRKKMNINDAIPEERDFVLRKLKEIGNLALQELNQLVDSSEVELSLGALLEKYQITPPSKTVSRVSSRASSIRDDQSELSSTGSGTKRILVQSRGLYRPAKDADSPRTSGTTTPTFSKKITAFDLGDAVQLPQAETGSRGSLRGSLRGSQSGSLAGSVRSQSSLSNK